MAGVLESKVFVRARRVRLLCGVAALLCLAGFLATANKGVLLMYNSWGVGLSGSCLELGRDPMARQSVSAPASGAALVVWEPWTGSYASAWRPFRAGNARAWRVMLPLWQPLLLFAVLAAGAHGMLIGARRADRNSCAACGYNLTSLPRGAERRCPECGVVDTRVSSRAGTPA